MSRIALKLRAGHAPGSTYALSAARPGARLLRLTLSRALSSALSFALSFALILAAGTLAPALAQVGESWIVTIDAASTQPVGTGFVPSSDTGTVLFFAEGAMQTTPLPGHPDDGWFGPAGRAGAPDPAQPILSGMPYGALIGGFMPGITGHQFLGRMGSFRLQPADVGQEFMLALNLSNADLATLNGQVTVTVIHLPAGSAEIAEFEILPTTPLPLSTGLFSGTGDRFVVLPYGAFRDPALVTSIYTDGHFGPEGLLGAVSPSQPLIDGPYGALLGRLYPGTNLFHIGDGGTWTAQPVDVGGELQLALNAGATAQAGFSGKFVVQVARVPVTAASVDPPVARALGVTCWPNPARAEVAMRFRLPREEPVRLRIHDAQGRWVRTVVDEVRPAGESTGSWDGCDETGRRLPAGSYFYQLSTARGSAAGRIVLSD